MAVAIFHMVKGCNEKIIVQLFDPSNDTGTNGIDLSGVDTGTLGAKAKHTVSGTVVTFNSASVVAPATDGKIELVYDTTDFTETGVYDLQIKYVTLVSLETRIYPSEGNQLKIRVAAAN